MEQEATDRKLSPAEKARQEIIDCLKDALLDSPEYYAYKNVRDRFIFMGKFKKFARNAFYKDFYDFSRGLLELDRDASSLTHNEANQPINHRDPGKYYLTYNKIENSLQVMHQYFSGNIPMKEAFIDNLFDNELNTLNTIIEEKCSENTKIYESQISDGIAVE